jgi:hypothetical protein
LVCPVLVIRLYYSDSNVFHISSDRRFYSLSVEQDATVLWKKIIETIVQDDSLKLGETCNLVDIPLLSHLYGSVCIIQLMSGDLNYTTVDVARESICDSITLRAKHVYG